MRYAWCVHCTHPLSHLRTYSILHACTHTHTYLQADSVAFFQVAWIGTRERVTWEPESSLPQCLINEFESHEVYKQDILTDASFGVINHTVVISKLHIAKPPSTKQIKCTFPSSDPG